MLSQKCNILQSIFLKPNWVTITWPINFLKGKIKSFFNFQKKYVKRKTNYYELIFISSMSQTIQSEWTELI